MPYVKNEQLQNLLTDAIETGATAYWMNDEEVVKDVQVKYDQNGISEIHLKHDVDGSGWKKSIITVTDVRKALETALTDPKATERTKQRAKGLLNDPDYDADAEDADVAIQLAIFNGDVVFG